MPDESTKGIGIRIALVATSLLLVIFGLIYSHFWVREPKIFDVTAKAAEKFSQKKRQVSGYVTTNTLLEIVNTLLDKPGGYLSNDKMPPTVLLDNIPSWEYGVIVQIRDFSKALRNDISRSQTQSQEIKSLALAENKFNIDHKSWLFPRCESEYRKGAKALEQYMTAFSDPTKAETQFFTRADNLRDWLKLVANRLGNFSQRLSASVGQKRINTDLAGEPDAKTSTATNSEINAKTPWLQIDDVFFESRGACWALIHLLKAIEYDFDDVLKKKNAKRSLQQIIRELESTQLRTFSPVVLNGNNFGIFANYSLVMSSYIARANAGIIELRDLLSQG